MIRFLSLFEYIYAVMLFFQHFHSDFCSDKKTLRTVGYGQAIMIHIAKLTSLSHYTHLILMVQL